MFIFKHYYVIFHYKNSFLFPLFILTIYIVIYTTQMSIYLFFCELKYPSSIMHAATVSNTSFVFSACICFIPNNAPTDESLSSQIQFRRHILFLSASANSCVAINLKTLTSVHIFRQTDNYFRVYSSSISFNSVR